MRTRGRAHADTRTCKRTCKDARTGSARLKEQRNEWWVRWVWCCLWGADSTHSHNVWVLTEFGKERIAACLEAAYDVHVRQAPQSCVACHTPAPALDQARYHGNASARCVERRSGLP